MVSDDAPVHDSTLSSNEREILHSHIQEVASRIEQSDIALAGLGIFHDVSAYYKTAASVEHPDALIPTLIDLLEKVIVDHLTADRGAFHGSQGPQLL